MTQEFSLGDLGRLSTDEIVQWINADPGESATSALRHLESNAMTAIEGFNAANRPIVDRLTTILMRIDRPDGIETRVKLLGDACFYFNKIGRAFDGIPRGIVAQGLAERHGLLNLERLATNALGTAYIDGACYEEACQTLERTLAISRQLSDPTLEMLAITNAAALLKEMGLYRDALVVTDKALAFDLASPRGPYLGFANATHGLFCAHRLRDDAAALKYLRIGSELLDDNPLADVVLKATFEYFRAMYLLFRHDNETAELLIEAARERMKDLRNPRVETLLEIAGALCDWASRDHVREMRARTRLELLHRKTQRNRLYHDDVLRALMEVFSRTLTGETERLHPPEHGVDALQRIIADTAKTGMRYAQELVDYTAGGDPSKELVVYTTGVKRAKFYRQLSDREAAQKNGGGPRDGTVFDPLARVRGWLSADAPAPPAIDPVADADRRAAAARARRIQKHDELTAIHGELARLRTETLRASMRTAAYDVAENWALAAEFFDDQTGQHCFRVGRLAGLLAAEIGIEPEECLRIEHAARLHDIGKIAVNEMILLKPGPLDAGEVIAMRAHTEVGAQLLEGSDDETLRMAALVAKYHHAWWNGRGYPAIGGDRIPLVARVCAFADVYDALTHERPYKRAWPHRLAIEQMMSESGEHFDPGLMRPFLRVLEKHVGSTTQPPSTQLHLVEMEANGLLTSRRNLMAALKGR